MKKQTAVEWLVESLETLKSNLEKNIISIEDYIINVQWAKGKAKAMGRQQIVDAYKQGQHDSQPIRETDAENYYNETYKGGNNE